jgi:predicted acyltransferase
MVLVNTPGNSATTYSQLKHVAWHGWSLADIVFPTFLWIVGVAMVFSLEKKIETGSTHTEVFWGVLRRSSILFLLGLFINGFPDFHWETWRILGVLQRIAICYFFGSILYLKVGLRGQLFAIPLLLVAYWLIMIMIPVPHFGVGHLDMARNLSHYVDYTILGPHNHLYTKTWDPEGFLGTIPSLATLLVGSVAGEILLDKQSASKVGILAGIGLGLVALGLIWNPWLPINKNLWTSSFSLFMAGLDFLFLSGLMLITRYKICQKLSQPFIVLGINAIAIYVISEILEIVLLKSSIHQRLYDFISASIHDPYQASLTYSLSYVLLMFSLAYILYRKKCFFRI